MIISGRYTSKTLNAHRGAAGPEVGPEARATATSRHLLHTIWGALDRRASNVGLLRFQNYGISPQEVDEKLGHRCKGQNEQLGWLKLKAS